MKLLPLFATTTLLISACAASNEGDGQETLNSKQPAKAALRRVCQYNPEKTTKPNPLGMRTFVQLSLEDGAVTATYEQFPSIVSADKVPVTRALTRYLVLPGQSLESARAVLLKRNDLWNELVGYEDSEGFGPVNEVLFCDSEATQPKNDKKPEKQPSCAYNPDSGKPNPLGMRHFVTIFNSSEQIDFVNEQFQYLVDGNLPAAAGYTVTLSVFNTDIANARKLVLSNGSRFGAELLSENGQDASGTILSEINSSLRCR